MEASIMPVISSIVAILISVVGGFLSWYHNDTQSKTRFEYTEDSLETLEKNFKEKIDNLAEKASHAEKFEATVLSERAELMREIARLDNTKASKEVADNFRNEIITLRQDIDKRFDKIERLLERVTSPKN